MRLFHRAKFHEQIFIRNNLFFIPNSYAAVRAPRVVFFEVNSELRAPLVRVPIRAVALPRIEKVLRNQLQFLRIFPVQAIIPASLLSIFNAAKNVRSRLFRIIVLFFPSNVRFPACKGDFARFNVDLVLVRQIMVNDFIKGKILISHFTGRLHIDDEDAVFAQNGRLVPFHD
jgi:hypothetical protein